MNDRIKFLIVKLSNCLDELVTQFLIDHLEDEENHSDVINLILSSYVSSLFHLMKSACQGDEQKLRDVNIFIKQFSEKILLINPIKSICSINNNRTSQ